MHENNLKMKRKLGGRERITRLIQQGKQNPIQKGSFRCNARKAKERFALLKTADNELTESGKGRSKTFNEYFLLLFSLNKTIQI